MAESRQDVRDRVRAAGQDLSRSNLMMEMLVMRNNTDGGDITVLASGYLKVSVRN